MNYLLEQVLWTINYPIQALLSLMALYMILFTMHNQERFNRVAAISKYPFVIYDTLVNITAFSILMLEPPQLQNKEFTVTARLKRYKKEYATEAGLGTGPMSLVRLYRLFVATQLCRLANKFDVGHC